MSYALMKDAKVMRRGAAGVEWCSVLPVTKTEEPQLPLMLWPTRAGAEDAARMQGATVVPANQVRA